MLYKIMLTVFIHLQMYMYITLCRIVRQRSTVVHTTCSMYHSITNIQIFHHLANIKFVLYSNIEFLKMIVKQLSWGGSDTATIRV